MRALGQKTLTSVSITEDGSGTSFVPESRDERESVQGRTKRGKLLVGLEVLVQQSLEGRLGCGTDVTIHGAAVFEDEQSRDAHHAQFGGSHRVVVDVELHDLEASLIFIRQFFQCRSNGKAGATPGCPEVEKYGHIRLQDFLVKVSISYIHDMGGGHRLSPWFRFTPTIVFPI